MTSLTELCDESVDNIPPSRLPIVSTNIVVSNEASGLFPSNSAILNSSTLSPHSQVHNQVEDASCLQSIPHSNTLVPAGIFEQSFNTVDYGERPVGSTRHGLKVLSSRSNPGRKSRETPYSHSQALSSSNSSTSADSAPVPPSPLLEAKHELAMFQHMVEHSTKPDNSDYNRRNNYEEDSDADEGIPWSGLSASMTESAVMEHILAQSDDDEDTTCRPRKLDGGAGSASFNSLDSTDLMLETEVGLDAEDDDVVKDLYGSEKTDPFLAAEEQRQIATAKTSTTKDDCVSLGGVTPVAETPPSGFAMDADKIPSSAPTVDKPLLRRLRKSPGGPMVTSFFAWAGDEEQAKESHVTEELNSKSVRRTSRRIRMDVGMSVGGLMSQSMHVGSGGDSTTALLKARPFPLTMMVEENSEGTSVPPATHLSSHAYDPVVVLFSSDLRQMMQDMSNMKLTLLKLRRMLIQDEGHQPAFRTEASHGLVAPSDNQPSTEISRFPPRSSGRQGVMNLDEALNAEPDTLLQLSKADLCKLIGQFKEDRKVMQKNALEQSTVIQLLQTQMTRYTTPSTSSKDSVKSRSSHLLSSSSVAHPKAKSRDSHTTPKSSQTTLTSKRTTLSHSEISSPPSMSMRGMSSSTPSSSQSRSKLPRPAALSVMRQSPSRPTSALAQHSASTVGDTAHSISKIRTPHSGKVQRSS